MEEDKIQNSAEQGFTDGHVQKRNGCRAIELSTTVSG